MFYNDGGNDDCIGSCETTVGDLMAAKGQTSVFDLKVEGSKERGKLVVICEKKARTNNCMKMKFKGKDIKNIDSMFHWWDKSDPYLKFMKIRDDDSFL